MTSPVLRVARPTPDLQALLPFYRDGLGLAVLAEFRDHAGFDGLILGAPGAPYHLEFTVGPGHIPASPSPDQLLVFYLPDPVAWAAAVARMAGAGFAPVPAFNPYWATHGRTFADPDGYRIVLQHSAWPPAGPAAAPLHPPAAPG